MARSKIIQRLRSYPDAWALGVGFLVVASYWLLAVHREFWFSEEFVRQVAHMPLSTLLHELRYENNPPLLFLLARVWGNIFGLSEAALRALSLGATLAFLALLRPFVARMATRGTAALAVLFAASSGMALGQSTEIRMYPLLLVWTVTAFLMTSVWQRSRSRMSIALKVLVDILGLLTHYTYIPVFILTNVYLIVRSKQRIQLWIAIGLTLLAIAPWYVYSFIPLVTSLDTTLGVQQTSSSWWSLFLQPLHVMSPQLLVEPAWFVYFRYLSMMVVGVVIFWFVRTSWRSDRDVRLLTIFSATSIMLLSLVQLTAPKYGTIIIPAVIALLAVGVMRVRSLVLRAVVLVIVIGTSLLGSILEVRQPVVTYRAAASIVEHQEQAGDRILVHPFNDELSVRAYYHGSLPILGLFPERTPGSVSFEDIVKYNFISVVNSSNIASLDEYVGDAQRIWFFYDVTPAPGYWNGDVIDAWFSDRGFRKTMFTDIFQNVPPLLIRYDRVE